MNQTIEPGTAHLLLGNSLVRLQDIAAGLAHCCVTSPPYFMLRNYSAYGWDADPLQIGQEATVKEFVDNLVAVFRQVWRVLRDDGTAFVVIGDSYDLKRSNLIGVPHRLMLALMEDGWLIRNDLIWSKANPPPSSVQNRFTCAHEHIIFMAKKKGYFFDVNAVTEPAVDEVQGRRMGRDVWHMAGEPFASFHGAVFPPKLVRRIVQAACGDVGACPVCGRPWRMSKRLVRSWREGVVNNPDNFYSRVSAKYRPVTGGTYSSVYEYGGREPTCDCGVPEDARQPCVVLDPFNGAGTSGVVATMLGHDYIGIDLVSGYLEGAAARMADEVPGVTILMPEKIGKEGHMPVAVGVVKNANIVIPRYRARSRYEAQPMQPFMKWVGGKRWLVPELIKGIPFGQFGIYCEPFLGAGAMFLALASAADIPLMVVGDANPDLISMWHAVAQDPAGLERMIHVVADQWFNAKDRQKHFHDVRESEPADGSDVSRAARFWYILKCGFNGVWRVNKDGKCNTSYGHKKNPGIGRFPNLLEYHHAIRDAIILLGDYRDTCEEAIAGYGRCLFYFDPPYDDGGNSDFTDYTAGGFSWQDQVDLAGYARGLASDGHFVMVSNSVSPRLMEIYDGFFVQEVMAPRRVSQDPARRGYTKELIFRSWRFTECETQIEA